MTTVVAYLRRPRVLDALFLACLLAAVWASYWPSLEHTPRADQWAYLIDTRDCDTLAQLWERSYSYNRVRTVGPGDTDLFRPVLFALLCAEKYCFGNNFLPSQAISLILHSGVVVLLFALLRRIQRSWAAAAAPNELTALGLLPHALTVFFALNFASMELVVWAHLHGYLLFLVFVLAALLLLCGYASSACSDRSSLVGCCVLSSLAAFTYELGQFFAVMVGVVLAIVARQRSDRRSALAAAACCVAILPLYQALNRWDYALHRGQFPEEGLKAEIAEKAVSLDTLEHAGRFLAFTSVQPFFPSVTGWWYQGERIHIQEPVFGWIKYVQPNAKLLLSYAIAALFTGLCVAGWRCRRREDLVHLWPMLAIPAGMYALYAGITVLGRMNLRPSHFVLCSNSYYTYIALLFLLIAAYTVWLPLGRTPTRRLKCCGVFLSGGLIFLGCYSSGRIHHAASRLRTIYARFHETVRKIDAFVAEHRHEPDFRLAFDMRPDDPFPTTHSIPFPLIFFSSWIDNHNPKYVVSFPEGEVNIVTADEYRRRCPEARGQLFPDLVQVGTDFNFYFWNGRYYATLHWDDVFRPELKEHAYVIEGSSLKEVLDQAPDRHEEFMQGLRTGWCIPPRLGTETLAEDWHGFAMMRVGAYFYAVPTCEGPFSVDRFNARRYSKAFVAEDLTMLQCLVEEEALAAWDHP